MKSKAKEPVHPTFGFAMRGDSREKWPTIVQYLWFVYHSVGEVMPTDTAHKLKPKVLNQPEECPFPERKPDDLTRHINSLMSSLQKYEQFLF